MTAGYLVAWCIYLTCGLLVSGILWYWTNGMKPALLRRMIRACSICVLLLPYYSDQEQTWLAPAIVVFVFDSMSEGIAGLSSAGIPILVAVSIALTFAMIVSVFKADYR